MVGGWFVGNFDPSVIKTEKFEVSVKHYEAGVKEPMHHHKLATEVTVLVSGTASMNGVTINEGEIVRIEKGEATNFEALTDCVTCVVKTPSAVSDKYLGPSE